MQTRHWGIGQDIAEPIQEITPPIEINQENLSPVDSPRDDVMQGSWCAYTSFSRHIKLVSHLLEHGYRKSEECPLSALQSPLAYSSAFILYRLTVPARNRV